MNEKGRPAGSRVPLCDGSTEEPDHVVVRLLGAFRDLAACPEVRLALGQSATLQQALSSVYRQFPQFSELGLRSDGSLADHVVVFLNGRNARLLSPAERRLSAGDRILLTPPIGGG